MKLKQIPLQDGVAKSMLKQEGSEWVKAFATADGLCVLYSLDVTHHGKLHHMSISRRDKYPTWEEISKAKEQIMGDIDTMMILPKKADYVNVHTNCFHVWETPEEWGIR